MTIAVTVIIPTFYRSELLRAAVTSCFDSAAGVEIEVIVVDDCSTQNIAEALLGFDVKLIRHHENKGSSAARNTGKNLANGQYIKFLDSDDLLVPGALSHESAVAEQTRADIVVSDWITCSVGSSPDLQSNKVRRTSPQFDSVLDDLLAGKGVPTSSALYGKALANGVHWDETMSTLNDWDYFMSAALQSKRIVRYDGPSYYWREHDGERITSGSSFIDNARSFYRILERLEETLRVRCEFTSPRQMRLAQYLYKELRGTFRFDPELGRRQLAHILALDPSFVPNDEERSPIFRSIGRVVPLRAWVPLYAAVRRLLP